LNSDVSGFPFSEGFPELPKEQQDMIDVLKEMTAFDRIVKEPVAMTMKFKLMKRFSSLLPDNAKEMSAFQIADIIRAKLAFMGE
jgi:hypothetical protein